MNTNLTRRHFFGVGGRALAGGGAILVGAQFGGLSPAAAATRNETHADAEKDVPRVGSVQLQRIHHDENLLPDREHAGFSALLYDADGRLVLHDGNKTWMYTTGLYEPPTGGQRDWYGKWVSHVREFNTSSLVTGEKQLVLGLAFNEKWAVIHNVVKVSDSLYVAFYSTNLGVRAAVSDQPNGMFQADPNFELTVTDAWEKEGGDKDSLESTGGHLKIDETDSSLSIWLMYDSYHVDKTAGLLGWAKVRIDKETSGVELLGKHPDNPLPVLPKKNYIAARAGGNLASDIRLGGKHALLYYTRPNTNKMMLTVALSSDPLFQDVTDIIEFEPPLGTEAVIEKFEAYIADGVLHVIYENKLDSNHWGTGIRLYDIVE